MATREVLARVRRAVARGTPRSKATGLVPLLLLAWLSIGEWQLFDRLLYRDDTQVEFVLQNVRGILAGTPIWKSSQHRLLPAALVAALEGAGFSGPLVLRFLFASSLGLTNLLLYLIVRLQKRSAAMALLLVSGFGCARLLLAFKLEYPWDGIDVLLFLGFGHWATRPFAWRPLLLMMSAGLLNHETVFYLPLWLLLAGSARERVVGALSAGVLAVAVYALREALYQGQPSLVGQVFEPIVPLISNPVHVEHNLRQLFVTNFRRGRLFVSSGVLAGAALLVARALGARERAACLWSLCVLATIVCFGYVNETRLYLPLLAFWCGYAGPRLFLAEHAAQAAGDVTQVSDT